MRLIGRDDEGDTYRLNACRKHADNAFEITGNDDKDRVRP